MQNKAEHGLAKFAHLNKVVDFVNVKAYVDNVCRGRRTKSW